MAIHEHIRRDGEKRAGTRRNGATVVSHCGGSVDGRFVTGKRIFHVELEGVPGSFLLENLGYTFGFIIVIMARQQLFTENTVTAVLPVMQNRQWATSAYLYGYGASCCWVIFSGQVLRRGHLNICLSSMKKLAMHLSKSAWMWWRTPQRDVCQRDHFRLADRHYGLDVSCSGCGKDCGDYIDDLVYCPGDTTHIVVGSVEILYLVFNGTLHWSDFIWPFALPTLAGEHLRRHLYLRVNESCTDS